MTRKRYKENQAAALLARIVDFTFDDKPRSAHKKAINELARVDFGFDVDRGNIDGLLDDDDPYVETLRGRWQNYLAWTIGRGVEPRSMIEAVDPPELSPIRRGREIRYEIRGDPGGALTFQLINLVRAAGNDRLRECGECKKIFVRRGRKEFCSYNCQKRVYMREWRKR
jgi:hypothetical protein